MLRKRESRANLFGSIYIYKHLISSESDKNIVSSPSQTKIATETDQPRPPQTQRLKHLRSCSSPGTSHGQRKSHPSCKSVKETQRNHVLQPKEYPVSMLKLTHNLDRFLMVLQLLQSTRNTTNNFTHIKTTGLPRSPRRRLPAPGGSSRCRWGLVAFWHAVRAHRTVYFNLTWVDWSISHQSHHVLVNISMYFRRTVHFQSGRPPFSPLPESRNEGRSSSLSYTPGSCFAPS